MKTESRIVTILGGVVFWLLFGVLGGVLCLSCLLPTYVGAPAIPAVWLALNYLPALRWARRRLHERWTLLLLLIGGIIGVAGASVMMGFPPLLARQFGEVILIGVGVMGSSFATAVSF